MTDTHELILTRLIDMRAGRGRIADRRAPGGVGHQMEAGGILAE